MTFAAFAGRAADTPITEGHQDLRFNFAPATDWSLGVFDHDTATEHSPPTVWFDVSAGAEAVVPAGAQWGFLGQAAGEPLWILPQVQDPDLPWLGTSTEGTAAGVLQNNDMRLTLTAAAGPGAFSLFTVSAFGTPNAVMTTSDGLSAADAINTRANRHAHYNWAFTEPGTYLLTFQASGTPVGAASPLFSDAVTLEFRVVPEPSAPLLLAAGLLAWRWAAGVSSSSRNTNPKT
ncbi:MAG: choice-of-anchor M domain-containing protein [Limisphaerales bacterium]